MNSDDHDEAIRRRIELESHGRALWTISRNVKGSVVNRGLVLAASLIVIDTLLVSHYQPGTALTLLRYTPPLTLLTGVLLNIGRRRATT